MNEHEPAKQAEALGKAVWKTRGARLTAHRRLQLTHQWSQWAIAAASIYVIVLSIAGLVIDAQDAVAPWLTVLAAGSATGILTLSLVEGGQRYEVRAERVHDCALELHALSGTIGVYLANKTQPVDGLESLHREYERILNVHKENHTPLDYRYFQATKPNDFNMNAAKRMVIVVKWSLAAAGRSATVILAPLLLAWYSLAVSN